MGLDMFYLGWLDCRIPKQNGCKEGLVGWVEQPYPNVAKDELQCLAQRVDDYCYSPVQVVVSPALDPLDAAWRSASDARLEYTMTLQEYKRRVSSVYLEVVDAIAAAGHAEPDELHRWVEADPDQSGG